ncbi:MAG: hypothetical protein QOJ40_2275, partial [Verrucomicrobiota bacterium]
MSMPNEPERPIEERLRAYAKKRRQEAGAPLELHPATRGLLQGEVARRFAKQERLPRSLLPQFKHYWPRLTSALAILALLALAAWLFLPGRTSENPQLAKMERRNPATVVDELRSAPSAPAPVIGLDANSRADGLKLDAAKAPEEQPGPDDVLAQQKDRELLLTLPDGSTASQPRSESDSLSGKSTLSINPADALGGKAESPGPAPGGQRFGFAGDRAALSDAPPAAAQTFSPSESLATGAGRPAVAGHEVKGKFDHSLDVKRSLAKANAPVAPAARVAGPGLFALGLEKNKDSSAQRFYRTDLPAEAGKLFYETLPAKAVLASFQLERSGGEVRVVDADGSVYAGQVEAPARTPIVSAGDKKLTGKALKTQERAGAPAQQALSDYAFRVTGTNRSLNEQVIFTGTVTTFGNKIALKQSTNAMGVGGIVQSPTLPADSAPLSRALPLNSRVS